MRKTLLLLPLLLPILLRAQADSSQNALTISGHAEVFYQYDLNQPQNNNRPGFLYSHNRHNEFNVNLAYLKAAYAKQRVRANFALMAGTYTQDNLAGEATELRPLYEANVGVQLAPKWWLDAGILPSHIGFESAKSSDCATLTRSLLAETSPYFETGAKLSYSPNERLTASFLVLNGWQRIAREAGSRGPNVGTQLYWKVAPILTVNHSSFVGYNAETKALRMFSNLYGIVDLHPRWQLTVGLDIGQDRTDDPLQKDKTWIGSATVLRWRCTDRNALALRSEYYTDPEGAILSGGLDLTGISLNYDRQLAPNATWRVEGRFLQANKRTFWNETTVIRNRTWLTTALVLGF
jgi:hypothetical protein